MKPQSLEDVVYLLEKAIRQSSISDAKTIQEQITQAMDGGLKLDSRTLRLMKKLESKVKSGAEGPAM